MGDLIFSRQMTPWLQPEFLFRIMGYKAKQEKYLKVLHGFTLSAIQKRRIEFRKHKAQNILQENIEFIGEMDDRSFESLITI